MPVRYKRTGVGGDYEWTEHISSEVGIESAGIHTRQFDATFSFVRILELGIIVIANISKVLNRPLTKPAFRQTGIIGTLAICCPLGLIENQINRMILGCGGCLRWSIKLGHCWNSARKQFESG